MKATSDKDKNPEPPKDNTDCGFRRTTTIDKEFIKKYNKVRKYTIASIRKYKKEHNGELY
jgi:hypothetical protein